jgi:hypothetical protein
VSRARLAGEPEVRTGEPDVRNGPDGFRCGVSGKNEPAAPFGIGLGAPRIAGRTGAAGTRAGGTSASAGGMLLTAGGGGNVRGAEPVPGRRPLPGNGFAPLSATFGGPLSGGANSAASVIS